MTVRLALAVLVAALATAFAVAPAGNATNECRGITACIRVAGPWVVVPPGQTVHYLLSCPKGRGVVGGLDAQATSRAVRVGFDGRIGAPVSPGVTTTSSALFSAVSTSPRVELFQPRLGCVPTQGGGGRSTVSARPAVTPAGPALVLRSRIVVIGPGALKFGKAKCLPEEELVGSWSAVAFRTKKPPARTNAALVRATKVVVGRQAVVTASATDRLSIDVHAVVQVGAECAP
ncbi:MAG TPA: hypothetical protein VH538_08045 [Gaiellaceae bacterium]